MRELAFLGLRMDASTTLEKIRLFLATPDVPELGPAPRPGVQSLPVLERELVNLMKESDLPTNHRELVRALILLWHDHLDASHRISQKVDDADGSYVHGIMHRREPDYGNAKYWFHRVGNHACFPKVADQASGLLAQGGQPELAGQLIPNGQWNPFAFIDLCQAVEDRSASDPMVSLFRSIQAAEIDVLLECFCT